MSEAELAAVLTADELEALQYGYRERVTDMQHAHIRELPQVLPGLFADAALRAERAGFDGVELHYAHAYTMASFLSRTNAREDGYGGARENRVRLPLEVFAEVRRRVGKELAVGCRFLADECIAGGNDVSDAAYFGVAFARAGMDFLSTSRGGKFDDAKQPSVGAAAYPYTGQSGYECMPQYISDERGPFGRNAEPTAIDSQGGAGSRQHGAGRLHRRYPQLRNGGRLSGAGRLRHRRRGAPVARRSGLVSQDASGIRRRGTGVRIHQLLRGTRPETQSGHLPALGQTRLRRS